MGVLRRWCCCCFGDGGAADGLVWDVALKTHALGDYSVAVAQANEQLEDQAQVLAAPKATLVGVYDGHGGTEAARFVNARLFSLIQEFAAENGGLSADVLTKAFGATEEEFLGVVQDSWQSHPRIMSVGSCCLVGAVEDGTLYVANLGDSRAVLGRRRCSSSSSSSSPSSSSSSTYTTTSKGTKKHRNQVVAERLSRDHNVADESVRREVASMHPDDARVVLNSHGVWRIKGIIQVSRSIGDAYLKRPDLCTKNLCPFPLRRPVMSAVPSIRTRRLRPGDRFVIFASDGLWDQLSDEAAVAIVARGPRKGVAMRLVRAAQMEVARKKEVKYETIRAVEKGHRRRFHDDITVVVLFLDGCNGAANKPTSSLDSTYAPIDVYSFSPDQQLEDPTRPVLH